jgi:hypothetical protein
LKLIRLENAPTYSFTKLISIGVDRTLPDDKRKEFRGSEFLVGISIPFK